jgi:hypothetical protein
LVSMEKSEPRGCPARRLERRMKRLRNLWSLLLLPALFLLLESSGCASIPVDVATKADLTGIAGDVAAIKSVVSAGGDVNDTWSVRLLVILLGMVALSYPVGKVLWIVGSRIKNGKMEGGPPCPTQ